MLFYYRLLKLLIICSLLLPGFFCWAVQQGELIPTTVRLKNYAESHGLPGETVRTVFQDSEGTLWLGVESIGLCRFNGIQYEVFSHTTSDSSSLSSDYVEVISEDLSGNLWVGTDFGLNKLDKSLISMSQGKRFTQFFHDKTPGSISGNSIKSLFRDSRNALWVGSDGGLDVVNADGITFRKFPLNIGTTGKQVKVNDIYEDKNHNLWIGTNKGLFLISSQRKLVEFFNTQNSDLHNDQINTICQDINGDIWLGTQSGISIYNPAKRTFSPLEFTGRASYMRVAGINKIRRTSDNKLWIGSFSSGMVVYDVKNCNYQYLSGNDKDPNGIATNQIRDFFQDRNGIVWISVKNAGLYIYDKRIETFGYITEAAGNNLGLSDKQVISIYEDKDGFIWIGTRAGGLNKYNPATKKFSYYSNNPGNKNSLSCNRIESITEDKNGILWLATVDGLIKFNRQQNRFYHYEFIPIKVIKEDKQGRLWLGTKKGIYRFDQQLSQYIPVNPDHLAESLKESITDLIIDYEGTIWAGTMNSGLIKYNPETNHIQCYTSNPNPGSLSNNMIRAIYEDSRHRLWIGSKQEGLDLYDRKTDKFRKFNTRNGLPSNSVFSITSDSQENIWLATNNGLSKFDPEQQVFENYSTEFGLQSSIFVSGAVCRTKNGTLLFGGDNGLNIFNPAHIVKADYYIPIRITSVKSNEGFIKANNIKDNELIFGYNDYLSFEFALLDLNSAQKNKYAYKLIGLNNDWIYSNSRNYVSYINLPPGEYCFMVKGISSDGKWSHTTATINFRIKPPWWLSWPAICFYIIFSIAIVIFSYKLIRFRALKENEVKMLKLEKEQSEALSYFKIRFFTNISHEIRIPLTLMLPTVDVLNSLEGMPSEAADQLVILKKNTNRLLNLVDELLEFRKIEQGQMPLKIIKSDIIKFISEITSMFKDAISLKKIEFVVRSEFQSFVMPFDPGAIEKVLSNLLSNAYKFTDENGKIELFIGPAANPTVGYLRDSNLEFIEIAVKDTGKGISKDILGHIFDRYYKSEAPGLANTNGIGIGLDFTKSLVELHHGYIVAESTENVGSTFRIFLPSKEISYSQNEFATSTLRTEDYTMDFNSAILSKISETKINAVDPDPSLQKKNSVLIIDDDIELLNLLNNILSEEYQVWIAIDGSAGLKLAHENSPDLIVSDVFMPGTNGYELCKKIKSEFKTSHIPVILLSAKAGVDNKIEGLESGADSYIAKPFHVKQLQIEIANLIKSRQKLKELFQRDIYFQPKELNIPSMDEKFITKCIEVVNKYMEDSEFGVVELGREVGLSRTQLFRKIKALLGQSPLEFIYSTRLKTAARLLVEKQFNISEVAYMTGFSNPASFSTSFRKYFGQSPSQFIAKHNIGVNG